MRRLALVPALAACGVFVLVAVMRSDGGDSTPPPTAERRGQLNVRAAAELTSSSSSADALLLGSPEEASGRPLSRGRRTDVSQPHTTPAELHSTASSTQPSAGPPATGCRADGAVVWRGGVVDASVPCAWGAEPDRSAPVMRADCAAASLLAAVHTGDVGRREVELVVSRFGDEDVSWSDPVRALRTVYRKLPDGAATGADSGEVLLRNVGNEAHTWAYHVAHNYDTLAERTVFMHGRRPSCGFFMADHREAMHGMAPGHLLANVSVFSYLLPSDGTFLPMTMRLDSKLTMGSLRAGFADLHDAGRQRVPLPVPQHPAGGADEWLPWERNDFGLWVKQRAEQSGLAAKAVMSFADFFRRLFGRAPPPVIYVAQGAQFAAPASALRLLPRSTYEWLLAQLEEGHVEMVYYLELCAPATRSRGANRRGHPPASPARAPRKRPDRQRLRTGCGTTSSTVSALTHQSTSHCRSPRRSGRYSLIWKASLAARSHRS